VGFVLKVGLTPFGCFSPKRRFENQKPTKTKKQALCFSLLFDLFVPLTIPLSNSFFQNLTDIYNLKELLYNEGIADIEGLPIVKPDNRSNSVLPNSY
jgi:hypothetical protein